jgi:hypothetical protein
LPGWAWFEPHRPEAGDRVFVSVFFLFYIFLSSFFKNTWSAKNLQNYTSSAVGDCGRDLPRGTVAPSTIVGHGGRGPVCFQKIVIFCLYTDGGKIYMKIVDFDEIYNFVVQCFSI